MVGDLQDEPARQPERDVRKVHSGKALELAEADLLAGERPVKCILLAGPPAAGKTTLVAGIYEFFRSGPFADFLFAGSQSLIGLEERCHLSRIASGLSEPDTYRTPMNDSPSFVHLRLRRMSLGAPSTDLLFADLSGEHFTLLRDTGETGVAAPVLRAADHVAFLLDGSRLTDARERFVCREDIKTLIRVCHEQKVFGDSARFQVVATKWDIVADAMPKAQEWAESALEELSASVIGLWGKGTVHRTAMRRRGSIIRGHGVSGLLEEWTAGEVPKRQPEPPRRKKPRRQSHRFGT
jgi:hypothetical protein